MKILYIDPWCANGSNLYYYTTGLVESISRYAEVTLVSQKDCTVPEEADYSLWKLFFPFSDRLKSGVIRTILRGTEYVIAYCRIIWKAKRSRFDVIHIEWPLLYASDIKMFGLLKKYCKILSLKAHNILPHSTGDKYVEVFRKIYKIPDIILVHGKNLREEFDWYFHDYIEKVEIQHDGRIYLFIGRIDLDKGVERFVKIWRDGMTESNALLVIAGKSQDGYDSSELKKMINECSNIILMDAYIPDHLLNYLTSVSDLVVLPYLKGSMSAVAITAAEFCKPVFTTRFGVIEEYIRDGVDGFVVDNESNEIIKMLKHIENDISNAELELMGESLNKHFHDEFNWETIGERLVKNVYLPFIQ